MLQLLRLRPSAGRRRRLPAPHVLLVLLRDGGQRLAVQRLAQAKVGQLHVAVAIQQEVVRLDVPGGTVGAGERNRAEGVEGGGHTGGRGSGEAQPMV